MDDYYQGEKFVYILIDKSANSNLHLILVDYDSRYVPVEENMFRLSITVLDRFSQGSAFGRNAFHKNKFYRYL